MKVQNKNNKMNINKLELEAIEALKAKNYLLAESLFKKLLHITDDPKEYLNNLGNISLMQKKIEQAIEYYNKALLIDKNINKIENQSIYYNLACAYQLNNDLDNTIKYLLITLEINKDHESAIQKINNLENLLIEESNSNHDFYNLAIFFHKQKKYQQAKKYYLLDIEYNNRFESNYNLGSIYQKLNNHSEALKYYIKANELKDDINTQFLINSINENSNIEKPPESYISTLFDYYSNDYDNDLLNNLSYKVPEYFFEIFKNYIFDKSDKFNILDLGCGTGLVGQKLKILNHKVSNLIGTDLSNEMINIAKQKKIYNYFYQEDIFDSLENTNIINSNINLITSADVFVYIGNLEKVLNLFKNNFKNCHMIFSIEINTNISKFKLTKSGRYQHNDKYIMDVINKLDLNLIYNKNFDIRKDKDIPVNGIIFLIKN